MLRLEITRDGLFLALGFAIATLGLVGCVLGLLFGPGDQAGVFALLGGTCALVLAGFGYTRLRKIDLSPTPDPPEVEARLGPFWAVLLAGTTVAAILVKGSSRGVWIFLAIVALYQLVMWARRRGSH